MEQVVILVLYLSQILDNEIQNQYSNYTVESHKVIDEMIPP